ncbi:hypothetical protein BMJ32_21690 [Sinorhizobium medicae]|nr:hypothetical protein BMJ32_21690 [Sinorhizobium medicae]PLU55550.1 hypothetical protein BMJ23_17635 [Sinorhizobium medicae]PLU61480.1 hypothetical protein BMJ22_31180 [Sinorhizobium medicae]PLU68696.1 hypothetical protein BMJ21_15425 [Sinorhizobium medicae]TWA29358.1 hypothetical protein FB006_102314 [Sinorhizobium medicae]
MKRSSDKTHAGLAASPQFRFCWLRTILAGTALALAATAQGPTASAGVVYGFTAVVCAPEDKVCEKYQKFGCAALRLTGPCASMRMAPKG